MANYSGNGNNNSFTGTASDDSIRGNGGNDTLLGMGGSDRISGGPGNDVVDGGDGNDFLTGNSGTDTLTGGQGQDRMFGGDGTDTLFGGTENDSLFGGTGNDSLDGGTGNDEMDGGAGDDRMSGGTGDDSMAGGGGNDSLSGGDGNDRIEGGAGTDLLYGGEGSDLMLGGDGTDTVYGDGGDDTLMGGLGADALFGGDGTDTIYGGGGRITTNLVQNGSFEDTAGMTETGYGYVGRGAAPGWTIANNEELDYHNDGKGGIRATHGENVADMGASPGNTTISQNVQGVIAGESYTLTFDVGDVQSGNNGLDVYFGGVLVARIDDPAPGVMTSYTYTLTGGMGDGSDTLTFTSTGPVDNDGVQLDNIRLTGATDGVADLSDDRIDGGAGNDILYGLGGNDSIDGGTGDDLLDGGEGNDTLSGGAGNDTLLLGPGDNTATGDDGDDRFVVFDDSGRFGTDSIRGGEGGETTGDVLDASGPAQDVQVTMTGPEAGVLGDGLDSVTFSEIEEIRTGSGNDSITGSDAGDTIRTGTGADRVAGGGGDDRIDVGAGDGAVDTLVLQNFDGDDTVTGFEAPIDNGDGTFTGGDQFDVTGMRDESNAQVNVYDVVVSDDGNGNAVLTFPDGTSVTLIGVPPAAVASPAALAAMGIPAPDFTVEGTDGDDLIDSFYVGDPDGDRVDFADAADGSNDDLIHGYGGNDDIYAFDGNDTVYGGDGDDSIGGGVGDDLLHGDLGNDTIDGGDGNDTVWGDVADGSEGPGNDDVLFGGGGDDTVHGGAGNDSVIGEAGNDVLYGGDGDDFLNGVEGDDTSYGGAGNDRIESGGGNDVTYGGDGDDSINGDKGADTMFGGAGNDYVRGSFGNDTVHGGTGDDYVWGGYGDDLHIVENDFGNDTHFGDSEDEIYGDTLDLSAVTDDLRIDLTSFTAEDGSFTDGTFTATFTEMEHIVLGSGRDTLVLADDGGADRVEGFAGPTDNGDGTFTGVDMLDTTALTRDFGTTPVTVNDVVVSDDGLGNAVLTFPGGESLTLIGVSPADIDSPAALNAIGIPWSDGTVTGTDGADTIDTTYLGDPDGDRVDANDAILPGASGNDDLIEARGGDDSVSAGAGDDRVYGGDGDDQIDGGTGNDSLYGDAGDDTLTGGTGADWMQGDAGNDRLNVSEGDAAHGGSGDDLFVVTLEDLVPGTAIHVDGGAGDEGAGDTLQLGHTADLSTLTQTDDGTGSFTGSVTLKDGTVLTFTEIENIICFTPGTRIATPRGARDVATLQVGEMVVTRDHGLQPIRWMGRRTVPALGSFAPVRIRPGVLTGLECDLVVSPQHRMLFQGYRAELLFGESEVLVAAGHLIDGVAVTQDDGGEVTYVHMLFDQHEIVFADGAATESFHPGEVGLSAVTGAARAELFALYPELRALPRSYGCTARRCLKRHEARLIL